MNIEDIPRPMRRINFVGANDDVDPIRGRTVFEVQAQVLPDLVRIGQGLLLETDRCGLYVVLMPASPGIAERLEHVAGLPCSCRSIVDVHADFWHPKAQLGGAVDWWRSGDHLESLERCIRAADLVTVPSPEYVESLLKLTPNVAVVPDCPDGELTEEAAAGWAQAMVLASGRPHGGHGEASKP
jgi:DNA-binding transcriptional LysR family regulator